MPYVVRSGVIGVAVLPSVAVGGQSLEELLYDVVQRALRDAGLGIEDIDGIVVASNDQYDGRAISVMAASGSVGAWTATSCRRRRRASTRSSWARCG